MWTRTTLNGKDVVVERDDYGDWVLVMNYEHYGGTDPESEVAPQSTFPQMPNGWTTIPDVQDLGGNGELAHVDNISQFGFTNVDSVRLYGESSSHNRILHYRTNNQTVIDSIVDNSTTAGHSALASSITKYTDHSTYLPDNVSSYSQTSSNTDRIFGYEFPMFGDGTGDGNNEHWALSGNGNRWEMDDFPGDASNTTIHRVWVRIPGGVNLDGTVMRTSDSLVKETPVGDR